MEDNVAAVLYGPEDLRIEKWPMPEINETEVLIKMHSVGICGTDLRLFGSGRCGRDWATPASAIVMGHEGAGVVVKVGSSVSTLQAGDRVAIEPTQPCRACAHCRGGRYNLCAAPRYCSTMDAPGNMCRYYKHVADFCHKIPDSLSLEEAAAIQPLAIAVHVCRRAGVSLGSAVAVQGAGPIGLLCALVAKAMGATSVVLTDIVESRLEIARQLAGVQTLLVSGKQEDEQTAVDKLVDMLGAPPDISIEASGKESAQRVAMMVASSGGVVVVVGISSGGSTVPLCDTLLREVDVRGSQRLLNSYKPALAAVCAGTIPLKSFITHHFPLERVHEAIQLARSGAAMKIIVHL